MNVHAAEAFRRLRETVLRHEGAHGSDGELLAAFLARRDSAAFGALVRRHGPMVLGVCRRILRHEQDAEDAFQVTFLVLARRAAAVVPPERVGNWLYGVAYRTALQARRLIARRRRREEPMSDLPQTPVEPEPCTADVQALVDRELSRLPDKLRLPVVLCDLEGHTHRDVARQLGVPPGTLSNRLALARRTLARRLAQRGLTLAAGTLADTLSRVATAAVPPTLVSATTRAAADPAAAVSAHITTLTEGVLKTMFLAKVKVLTSALLLLGLVSGGAFWVCRPTAQADTPAGLLAQVPLGGDPVPKKTVDHKTILDQATKAAAAMPAVNDEQLHRKVKTLVSIAIRQAATKQLAAAAATFKVALDTGGSIKAEVLRAEAQSHIGFYQANAGLITDAQKTHDAIQIKDAKKAREAQDARNKILLEMTAHLAKTGDIKEALKIAEAIPVPVMKFKGKDGKEVEHRDATIKDAALKFVVEGQLKGGDVAGAHKTIKAMEAIQSKVWPLREAIIAQGLAGDLPGATKFLQELRKKLEADKWSSPSVSHLIASTQAAMGDAEGALVWINQLPSEEERANALLGVSIGLAELELAKKPKTK
jgi:RNA polymerase sigma factor (sigma-70 family)